LRVRDLLFARKPRKKQIPHPVQKPNGVRNDIFLSFFRRLLGNRVTWRSDETV
jgi:hypothetical protein